VSPDVQALLMWIAIIVLAGGYVWLDRPPHYRLRNRRFVRRAQAEHDREHQR
jgi:hypothetical protein